MHVPFLTSWWANVLNAIREKTAPAKSMVRKVKSALVSEAQRRCGRSILIPTTLPLRFHISKYGGNRPTARSTAAMTPIIVTGHETPRE